MFDYGNITRINEKYIFINGERKPINKEDVKKIHWECGIMIAATRINVNEAQAIVDTFAKRGHEHRERMLNATDRFTKECEKMHADEAFYMAKGASEIISFLYDRMKYFYKIQNQAYLVMQMRGEYNADSCNNGEW